MALAGDALSSCSAGSARSSRGTEGFNVGWTKGDQGIFARDKEGIGRDQQRDQGQGDTQRHHQY